MTIVTVTYELPDEVDPKEFVDVVTGSDSFESSYVAFTLGLSEDQHVSIPASYTWGDGNVIHGIGEGSLELCEAGQDDCEHDVWDD